MKLLKAIPILFIFSISGYSQSKKVMKYFAFSQEFLTKKYPTDRVSYKPFEFCKTCLRDLEFPDDWPAGNYRMYLKLNEDCKLTLDEKKRITHEESDIKFDLTGTQLKTLNQSLSLIKVEYYDDGVLIESGCKNGGGMIPITITIF